MFRVLVFGMAALALLVLAGTSNAHHEQHGLGVQKICTDFQDAMKAAEMLKNGQAEELSVMVYTDADFKCQSAKRGNKFGPVDDLEFIFTVDTPTEGRVWLARGMIPSNISESGEQEAWFFLTDEMKLHITGEKSS